MNRKPGVVMIGFQQRKVPIEVLEKARRAVEGTSPAGILALGARGVVAVATCHRLELYVEGASPDSVRTFFAGWTTSSGALSTATMLENGEAARHLFRVSAGLEAAVLGDDNILGQLRSAYRAACDGRMAGPLLHRMFHCAFRAGKRVRSETDLGRGGRSVAGEAVAVINRKLGGLASKRVLVLGAGDMARIAAGRLAKRGTGQLVISNRSYQRASDLAASTGGEVVPWSWRARALASADAVIVGTGAPEPVLSASVLRQAASARGTLLAVDLSLPRNLETPSQEIPGLEIIDLETLGTLLEAENARRRDAVAAAEYIVEQEVETWLAWSRSRRGGRRPSVTAAG